jgi:hypothetical protein
MSTSATLINAGGVSPTQQEIRDALKLAPTAGDPATGSIDKHLDDIGAKTTNLPSDPADESAIEAAITAATSSLATASAVATVDGIVDAIKLKTDNIPASPAVAGEAAAALVSYDAATGTDVTSATSPLATLITELAKILKCETNNNEIINGQLIYYDNDGTTPLFVFDLFDKDGAPCTFADARALNDVFKRIRVV